MARLVADQPPVFHRWSGGSSGLASFYPISGAILSDGHGFFTAGAFHERQFCALLYLVQMIGVAIRLKVNVGLVVSRSGGLDGVVVHVRRQFLKSVIGVFAHQVALFQPPFNPRRGANVSEAAIASEHLHNFAVLHRSSLVEDRGHLIAQKGLRRGHVSDLFRRAGTIAATKQGSGKRQAQTEFDVKLHWNNISSR